MTGLWDSWTALLALAIFAAFLVGWRLLNRKTPRRGPRLWTASRRSAGGAPVAAGYPAHDAAEQLRAVMAADFRKRPLLSKAEARVFKAAEATVAGLGLDWRVMAQVSLGEILASEDRAAFRSINSKRVDILLISRSGEPMAAIEYQGSGHHLGNAAARDAVKKEALRRAGVAYIEVFPDHELDEHLRSEIGRASRPAGLRTAA